MSAKKSNVWKYFVRTLDGGKCKLCHTIVKTSGNTTNLNNHLKRKHYDIKVAESTGIENSTSKKSRVDTEISPEEPDEVLQSVESATVNTLHEYFVCSKRPSVFPELRSTQSSPVPSSSSSSVFLEDICYPAPQAKSTSTGMRTQPLIDDAICQIKSFEDGGTKFAKVTNAILFMIAKDNMPLNTTEHEGFKYLMRCTVPLYKVPGRKTITSLIDQKYEVLSHVVKETLSRVQYVTLTSDVWTDTLNTKSYLGMTVHYLHEQNLHSTTIGVVELEERHTADYLGQWLSRVCEEWAIGKDKVVAVVTDSGPNIVKAVLDSFGKSKHLNCFAHIINLVATHSLDTNENVKVLCDKLKTIVTFFKHSVTAADKLRKCQSLKLVQSVPTRWNSTYYMLERFLKVYEHVGAILLKYPKSPPMLTAAEIETAKEIQAIMKPIEVVTKEVCGEKYVTGSKVIPLINCLMKKVKSLIPETADGKTIKEVVLSQLFKRFGQMEMVTILSVSTLLDPRFKRLHFNNPNACAETIQKVTKAMSDLKAEENLLKEKEVATIPENPDSMDDNLWSFHQELVSKSSVSSQANNGGMPTDLKHYLNQPTIELNSDPMNYWSVHKTMFPLLSSVADRYLPVVATSVPSERLFSRAGNIMAEKRNRLSGTHLNKLLFLNSLDLKEWCL